MLSLKDSHWHIPSNKAKALILAKRQLEFNRLMLDFYTTGEQEAMNSFLRSCLYKRIIQIMKE